MMMVTTPAITRADDMMMSSALCTRLKSFVIMFYVIDFQITLSILLCRIGHYDVRNGHTSFISGGNNAITNVRIVIPDEVRDLFFGGGGS